MNREGMRPGLTLTVVVALFAVLAAARWHTRDEPLERDLATYAVIAHECLGGRALYADVWDHKPPAIHATYALGELVAGYGTGGVYAVNLAAGLVTLLAVLAATTRLAGRSAGLWAAAFWTAVSGNLYLQANQPNTEAFLNPCLAVAVAALAGAGRGRAVVAGAAFALASLYKPIAVFPAAALMAAHVAAPAAGMSRRRALGDAAFVAVVGAVVWAGLHGYFAASGRLGDFRDAVFAYNQAYVGDSARHLLDAWRPSRLLPGVLTRATWALLALAPVGVILAWRRGARRGATLLLAYAASLPLAIGLSGYFWPHYYQLWLPLLAIAGGVGISELVGLVGGRKLLHGAGAVVLAALSVGQIGHYRRPAEDWSRAKYGEVFLETRALAARIEVLLEREETFYVWGSETGAYLETRRSPVPGVFYSLPLEDGPLAGRLVPRVVAALAASPPELFVRNTAAAVGEGQPILDWLEARYRPLAGEGHGPFTLAVRRGGALEARLQAPAR